jgi:large subunit ribosomal protein L3
VGKNIHKGSPSFGQEVVLPATVVECPPLKVFGVRAYEKAEIGEEVLSDALAENVDKYLLRKILNFKKPANREGKAKKSVEKREGKEEDSYAMADFEKELNDITRFTLLVHTQPAKSGFKKKPDISEVWIGGTKEQQLAYAKEKLGKEIAIDDLFKEGDLLDVKAVTKGKGYSGPVKRFHIRTLRPKSKKQRVVGSIGPWHPHTVMFTVARPGQMGYQSRTETGKKILKISDKVAEVNPKAGFQNYGMVKEKYAIIAGSLPGPAKRCIAFRKTIRPETKSGAMIEGIARILSN